MLHFKAFAHSSTVLFPNGKKAPYVCLLSMFGDSKAMFGDRLALEKYPGCRVNKDDHEFCDNNWCTKMSNFCMVVYVGNN